MSWKVYPVCCLIACLLALLPWIGSPAAATEWMVRSPAGVPVPPAEFRLPAEESDPASLVFLAGAVGPADAEPEFDFGSYQMVGRSGPYRLIAGRQDVAEHSLILDHLRRRGLSLSLQEGPRQSALTGFVLRTVAEAGESLGLEDQDNRMAGVMGEMSPLEGGVAVLHLTAGYLAGRGPGGVNGARGGAWSLAAEAGFWQNLQLRGEIAGTGYDPGDPGQGLESGLATTLQINYHSLPHPADRTALFWHVGAENRRVDPFFHSLGNPGLPADLEQLRLFGGVRRNGLNLDFSLARERNNLADSPRDPTWSAWRYALQVDYTASRPFSTGLLARLGVPGVKLALTGMRRQPLAVPEEFFLDFPIDCSSRELRLQALFRHSSWRWGIGGSLSGFRDHGGGFDDSRSRSIEMNAEVPFGSRLVILPVLRHRWVEDLTSGEEHAYTDLNLDGRLVLIRQRLTGRWHLGLDLNADPAGVWQRTAAVSGKVVYGWRPPEKSHPGFDLSLSSSWLSRHSEFGQIAGGEDYRIFLALTMRLPSA